MQQWLKYFVGIDSDHCTAEGSCVATQPLAARIDLPTSRPSRIQI